MDVSTVEDHVSVCAVCIIRGRTRGIDDFPNGFAGTRTKDFDIANKEMAKRKPEWSGLGELECAGRVIIRGANGVNRQLQQWFAPRPEAALEA